MLTNSFATLKTAEAKFKAAMGCLNGLGKPAESSLTSLRPHLLLVLTRKISDKEMLVPLTSSLYVPGKLSDVHNVLVDVGTGYYVEKVSCAPPGNSESIQLTSRLVFQSFRINARPRGSTTPRFLTWGRRPTTSKVRSFPCNPLL